MATIGPVAGSSLPNPATAGPERLGPTTTAVGGTAPATGEAAAFSDAIQASSVPRAGNFGAQITAGVLELSSNLSAWHSPQPLAHAEPGGGDTTSLTAAMKDAVSGMQGAYVFAIEATLASRGSTEGTKVINTLLKGQ